MEHRLKIVQTGALERWLSRITLTASHYSSVAVAVTSALNVAPQPTSSNHASSKPIQI